MYIIACVDAKIRSYTGGMVQTNAYLLGDNDQCILIDAPSGVSDWLQSEGATPSDLLLTHQHYDHVEDVAKLAEQGVRVHAYAPYSQELTLEKYRQMMGMPLAVSPYKVDELLENAGSIKLGEFQFDLAHVPGHAPDSLVFIIDDYAFVGDTLFAGSVGRPDLPGGNMEQLMTGICQKLLTLDDSTHVLPGHGPLTSIGEERSGNPHILRWASRFE